MYEAMRGKNRTVCGEGISYDREAEEEERAEGEIVRRVLCRGCADVKARYYQPV